MPGRKISKDLKERAIFLTEHPEICSNVEEVLGVSKASIYRWKQNLQTFGSVERPSSGKQGRPEILDKEKKGNLCALLAESPELYLEEVREWVEIMLDTPISASTVYQNILDAGYTHKKMKLRASQRDEIEIAEWRVDVAERFYADQLISIDKSSKDGRTLYRTCGWGLKGQDITKVVDFPRGERYSLLPALTIDGYIAKRVVQDSVDTATFVDFILEDVLPQMNPFPGPRSVILMDNCSIHKNDRLIEIVEAEGCYIHFLPPYAPELNPIEESFAAVKAALRRDFRRLGRLPGDEALLESCSAVTPEKAAGWFRHSGYEFK